MSYHLPEFLSERIHRDLSVWDEGITNGVIEDATEFESSLAEPGAGAGPMHLVLEIRRNRLHHRVLAQHEYTRVVLAFFDYLTEHVRLPDVRLVVNCRDWPVVMRHQPIPVFSFVTTALHHDLSLPNPHLLQWLLTGGAETYPAVPWDAKRPVAFFRGSSSGPRPLRRTWHSRPRVRVLTIADRFPDLFDVGITFDWMRGRALRKYYREAVPLEEWGRYRYIVHLDGNTAAFRLANTMRTGSAILKQDSPFVEYWYDGIRPDVHYRRVRANLADLPDQVRFLMEHDQQARGLAEAAEAFAAAHLTRAAVCAYVVALLEAYAGLPWHASDDRPSQPGGRWQALWSRIRG